MKRAEYDAVEAVNATTLKRLLIDGPAACLEPARPTPAMDKGRALHCCVLEPDKWTHEWTYYDGVRRGKKWEAYREEHANQEFLAPAEYRHIEWLSRRVLAHPIAGKMLRDLHRAGLVDRPTGTEITLQWEHRATGLQIKSRLDFVAPDFWGDLKTSSAAPATYDPMTLESEASRQFVNDCWRREYPVQLALYADGLAECGYGAPPCKLIAVQTTEPHMVAVLRVPEEWLDIGRQRYEQALAIYAECLERDQWPAIAENKELDMWTPSWVVPEQELDLAEAS